MSDNEKGGNIPTDAELRNLIARTMEQMFLQSQATTKLLLDVEVRLAGVSAANEAVARVVDDNAASAEAERQLSIGKALVDHLFERSHQYVTVIVAGAFAAYFTMFAVMSDRFKDHELRVAAALMTVSLTLFVLWEVMNMFIIGRQASKGDISGYTQTPAWLRRIWYIVLIVTLSAALPAVGLSMWVYLRGLGVPEILASDGDHTETNKPKTGAVPPIVPIPEGSRTATSNKSPDDAK